MISPRTAAVAVLLAGTTLSTLSASPASAEVLRLNDAAADMWDDTNEGYVPAPAATNADLRAVTARHKTSTVVVRAGYTDLRRDGYLEPLGGQIRTDEGRLRSFSLRWNPNDSAPDAFISRGDGGGGPLPCDVTGGIDLDAKTAFISIPRSCLSAPRWVQLRFGSVATTPANEQVVEAYFDSALDSGPEITQGQPFARRLARG